MYFVTGSNLFKQWIGCDNYVLDKFTVLTNKKHGLCDFDVKTASLVYIGWSHNIFYFDNNFYIVGDYKSSGKCMEQLDLPKECTNSSDVTVVSDEYRLVFVKRDTCEVWSISFENYNIKKLNLTTEAPIEIDIKRSKKEDHILKCALSNESLIFMTSNRFVYCGSIPSLMDTNHCLGDPKDIQCGNEHYMLLTTTGRLYTWGNGRRLQLGHGDVNIIDIPTEVEALSGIKIIKIAAGGWHSLALSEFGDLYAWGWNDTGQLGVKETSDHELLKSYALPTLVDIFEDTGTIVNINVKDIACGSRHSAILLNDGSVWTSGYNKYGQLGHSIQENPSVHHFKKCTYIDFMVCDVMCGQWSTVLSCNLS